MTNLVGHHPLLLLILYRPEYTRAWGELEHYTDIVLKSLDVVNTESMLRSVTQRGGVIGVCGTCMDARGITDEDLVDGCHRSTMDELTEWTQRADQVLVF